VTPCQLTRLCRANWFDRHDPPSAGLDVVEVPERGPVLSDEPSLGGVLIRGSFGDAGVLATLKLDKLTL
jgi:hypothetical protein